jgi:hypothetical protein
MTALSEFLVLLMIFLLANLGDAFMNLSTATKNLVWMNLFIQFEESIKEQKNKPSCKRTNEPIKRMDLDAELLNIILQIKTQVAYSEPEQDVKLPSKIIDLTDTQPCGLCHD